MLHCCRSKYADVEGKFPVIFYIQRKNKHQLLWYLGCLLAPYTLQRKKIKGNKTELKENGSRREWSLSQSWKKGSIEFGAIIIFVSFQIQVT